MFDSNTWFMIMLRMHIFVNLITAYTLIIPHHNIMIYDDGAFAPKLHCNILYFCINLFNKPIQLLQQPPKRHTISIQSRNPINCANYSVHRSSKDPAKM